MAKSKLDYNVFTEKDLKPSFWAKVKKTDGCWLWTGKIDDGYGRVNLRHEGKTHLYGVHRLMSAIYHGGVDKDVEVDHLCRIRHCCNPDHLEQVTTQENTRRGKGRKSQPDPNKCVNGHPLEGPDADVHVSIRRTRRGAEVPQITCRVCNWSKKIGS